MKQTIISVFLMCSILVIGCSSDQPVTENQAKQLVVDEHDRSGGTVDIVSISTEEDKYIIAWEIDPISEGKDSVDKETGQLKMIESSHGTCQWR